MAPEFYGRRRQGRFYTVCCVYVMAVTVIGPRSELGSQVIKIDDITMLSRQATRMIHYYNV